MAKRAGNPNIAEAGKATRFSKENRPANPGRKPSVLKKWVEKYDLSKKDIHDVFINFLFAKSVGEIEKMASDKGLRDKLPAALGFQLQVLFKQAQKGDGRHMEAVLHMLLDKSSQTDIIGVLDIPNSARDRLGKIFGEACKKPVETRRRKPQPESPPNEREKR